MVIDLQDLKKLPAPCVHDDPDALLARGGTAFTVLVDFAREYGPGSRSGEDLDNEWQEFERLQALIAQEQMSPDPNRRRRASKAVADHEAVGGKCSVDILIESGGIRNKLAEGDRSRVKQIVAAVLTAYGRPTNSTGKLRLHLGAGYYLEEVELMT